MMSALFSCLQVGNLEYKRQLLHGMKNRMHYHLA
jgi:hypothetical protein